MKSIFILIPFAAFTLQLQAQTSDTTSARGCNTNTPGFGKDLGTITRGEEIEFGGKIWSGPVTASNCQKETFNGGRSAIRASRINFNADCRTNPGHPGDLFSWCAVMRFADTLCPHPWRVPAEQDFRDLMTTVCGYYNVCSNQHPSRKDLKKINECMDAFSSHWSQSYDNYCDESGDIIPPYDLNAIRNSLVPVAPSITNNRYWQYWSQTEQTVTEVSVFGFWIECTIASKPIEKNMGVTLRCVKDK